MSLFQKLNFTSAAGLTLFWKVECDLLTESDWATLAKMVSDQITFGEVEGVPRGGLPFAEALKPYITSGPLLIVDDVLTTGLSMERHRNNREAIGVAVFSRGLIKPNWIKSIWTYSLES
jgi:hypothetical protein